MTRRILAFADILPAEAPEREWIRFATDWLGVTRWMARNAIQNAIDCGLMVVVRTEVLA